MRCHYALHNPIKCQGAVKSMNGTIYSSSVFTGVATGLTTNRGIGWAKQEIVKFRVTKITGIIQVPDVLNPNTGIKG